jgi:enoyl-CoA hydratase/carnithine racemase
MSDPILLQRDGTIATVVLNSPQSLNAFTERSWQSLGETMRRLSADENLRCVILRGAGDKAFAAGADIAEFDRVRSDSRAAKKYGGLIHEAMQAVAECRHPTLAQIHGVCVGGGLEIAAMCDMRICGSSSRFGIPINKLGLVMAYGELQGLLSVVGRAAALEILLEGRVFGADEALAKGLVNRVVADDKVAEECRETSERIAAGAPLVARWHKKFIRRLADPAPIPQTEWDEGFACFDTEDYAAGRAAFLAKTKPEFHGR